MNKSVNYFWGITFCLFLANPIWAISSIAIQQDSSKVDFDYTLEATMLGYFSKMEQETLP